ncbi:ATPase, partial [Parabacteroides sp. OttesenSCG-928-O15]|nr:ATPase [Parabacteroides sp. OttesenSCG-928-O15]
MIIPMKKYAFMVYHKEYKQFLSTLRDLGVVHIKETKSINDFEDLQHMISERKRVTTLLKLFKKQQGEQQPLSPARTLDKEEGMALVQSIEDLQEERSKLSARKQAVLKDLDYMDIWGDFDMKQIKQLKKEGYELNFFTCPTSKYEPVWGKEYNAFLVNNFQSVTYFVTVTKTGTEIDIDAERPKMPELGLSQLREKVKELNDSVRACDERLQALAVEEYNTLLELDKQLQNEFNLANAVVQTDRQAGDKLMFLEGWVTADKASDMEEALDKEAFFYQELEIQEDDKIPIKLKNNSYSKLFEPITEMYSLPNYKEFDPTPFVAPFFMLFFGLCFGDGGYGLLILLICTILKRKANAGVKPFLTLFQWLGAMTVVVGALTGSFFGIALVDIPQFAAVKDYFLSSDNLMTLSVVIGIIHILYAKTIAAYKTKIQRGLKYSLAPFAWVFVIAALACVFGLPMLDIQLPQPVTYVLYGVAIVCLAVALLYNTPGKNILLNFGSGLWNTYNMVFGLLGDV